MDCVGGLGSGPMDVNHFFTFLLLSGLFWRNGARHRALWKWSLRSSAAGTASAVHTIILQHHGKPESEAVGPVGPGNAQSPNSPNESELQAKLRQRRARTPCCMEMLRSCWAMQVSSSNAQFAQCLHRIRWLEQHVTCCKSTAALERQGRHRFFRLRSVALQQL